jgi:hypothetical protein
MKKLIFLTILLLNSLCDLKAQTNSAFTVVTVDACCVKVWIRDDLFAGTWTFTVGMFSFNNTNTLVNGFDICFSGNDNYTAMLTLPSASYSYAVNIAHCSSLVSNGFHYVTVTECCVEVLIINKQPKRSWTLNMGNGTIIYSDQNGSDKVNYCYSTSGNYTITLTYSGGGGAIWLVNISTQKCQKKSDYWLCLTDYYGAFGCSAGITVKINGVVQNIPFTKSVSNASYGVNDMIAELTLIANNLGVTYVNYAPQLLTCHKGPGITHGHFFLNSPVEFLTLYGDNSCTLPQYPNAGSPSVPWLHN